MVAFSCRGRGFCPSCGGRRMRHPVSTSGWFGSQERLGSPVEGDVIGTAILPAAPEDPDPRASEDPDGVRMIAAARPGARVDGGGPRRGVAGVVGKSREGLPEAFVAGPAEGDAVVFARGVGHRGDAAFSGELVGGREASAVIAEFGEDLGGVDVAAAGQALQERPIGMLLQGRGDGGGQLLDVGDEGEEDGDESLDEFAARLALGVAGATQGGAAEPGQQLGGVG